MHLGVSSFLAWASFHVHEREICRFSCAVRFHYGLQEFFRILVEKLFQVLLSLLGL